MATGLSTSQSIIIEYRRQHINCTLYIRIVHRVDWSRDSGVALDDIKSGSIVFRISRRGAIIILCPSLMFHKGDQTMSSYFFLRPWLICSDQMGGGLAEYHPLNTSLHLRLFKVAVAYLRGFGPYLPFSQKKSVLVIDKKENLVWFPIV